MIMQHMDHLGPRDLGSGASKYVASAIGAVDSPADGTGGRCMVA